MPDYERKAKVISSGLVNEYRQISRTEYAHYYGLVDMVCKYDIETAELRRSFFDSECPEDWKEAKRVYRSDKDRNCRLRKRIEKYLEKPCVFATLTFTDDVLAVTSPETRRKYVTLWLKSQSPVYVANKDFGGLNGREHYHAVIQGRIDPTSWKYGACNVQKIRNNGSDSTKLAKYTAKLTNHAIKETCKRSAIIYSRDT